MRSLALSLLWAAAFALCAEAEEFHRCTRVIDGDTIELEAIGVVRLIGVDTPDAITPKQGESRPRDTSHEFLCDLVEGGHVRLEYDRQRKDKYGRTLAYVFLPDSTFVNEAIVRFGHGRAYTKYPFRYEERFRRLEEDARTSKLGIWMFQPEHSSNLQRLSSTAKVYVTKTGSKYHREGCRYLARSALPIELAEAMRSYGPCSVCDPPSNPQVRPSASPSIQNESQSQTSSRCRATTQKGTQCKRKARSGSSYCWQHDG